MLRPTVTAWPACGFSDNCERGLPRDERSASGGLRSLIRICCSISCEDNMDMEAVLSPVSSLSSVGARGPARRSVSSSRRLFSLRRSSLRMIVVGRICVRWSSFLCTYGKNNLTHFVSDVTIYFSRELNAASHNTRSEHEEIRSHHRGCVGVCPVGRTGAGRR